MAIARQTDGKLVKPLHIDTCTIERYTCGSTITAGELVVMSADGFIDPADTTSAAVTVLGVAVTNGLINQVIDVVTEGRITSITGGTPGKTVHASDSAGEPAETAGSNAGIAGTVVAANILRVRPVTGTV